MKKGLIKNLALGLSAIAGILMINSCEISVAELGPTVAVSGAVENYNTSLGGYDASTGITIEFNANNLTSDWDSIFVQTESVRIMAPNLGYWPSNQFFGNLWPSNANKKNGADWNCLLNLSSNNRVKIAIDSTIGIRYYLNDQLKIYYPVTDEIAYDTRSSVTSISSITIGNYIKAFFEDIQSDVTFGTVSSGSISNLSISSGVPAREPEIDPTPAPTPSSLPYTMDSVNSGTTIPAISDITTTTGASISIWVPNTYSNDWNQLFQMNSGTDIYFVALSLLNHWNNGAVANTIFEGVATASNGGSYNSFYNQDAYATISFNADGSIVYYKNGMPILSYAASSATSTSEQGSSTVGEFNRAILNYINSNGIYVAYDGLKKLNIDVAVNDAAAKSLFESQVQSYAIDVSGAATTYTVGRALDTSGVKVRATCTNGKVVDLGNSNITVTLSSGGNTENLQVGDNNATVTVTYGSVSNTFQIAVTAPTSNTHKMAVGVAADGTTGGFNVTSAKLNGVEQLTGSVSVGNGFKNNPDECGAKITTSGNADFEIVYTIDCTGVTAAGAWGPWNIVIKDIDNPGEHDWVVKPDAGWFDALPSYSGVSSTGNTTQGIYDNKTVTVKVTGTEASVVVAASVDGGATAVYTMTAVPVSYTCSTSTITNGNKLYVSSTGTAPSWLKTVGGVECIDVNAVQSQKADTHKPNAAKVHWNNPLYGNTVADATVSLKVYNTTGDAYDALVTFVKSSTENWDIFLITEDGTPWTNSSGGWFNGDDAANNHYKINIAKETWVRLTYVFSGSTVTVYKDSDTSNPVVYTVNGTSAAKGLYEQMDAVALGIGGNLSSGEGGTPWLGAGYVDTGSYISNEILVYNKALSAEEIAALN